MFGLPVVEDFKCNSSNDGTGTSDNSFVDYVFGEAASTMICMGLETK